MLPKIKQLKNAQYWKFDYPKTNFDEHYKSVILMLKNIAFF